ncbi:hypothetical protein AMJ51_02570 [Microgenomates bacterium DG_75]|nr:MAG: hypothetical protein AMJ51_02570 [Microgenomates bacterium DG_75]
MRQSNHSSNSILSSALIEEIKEALSGLDYGSVEIYIQDGKVTQITKRRIKKTNHRLQKGS